MGRRDIANEDYRYLCGDDTKGADSYDAVVLGQHGGRGSGDEHRGGGH